MPRSGIRQQKAEQAEHQQQPNAPAAMPPKKQKVLELDDEPRLKQEPGVEQQQQQQQQQLARDAQGVLGGDGVVEALVVSNSRLCAQVAACDARAFTEWERSRVLEDRTRVL